MMESKNTSLESYTAELNFTTEWNWRSTFEACSLTTISLLGVILNFFVFLLYRVKSSFRNSANIFVLSLCASDGLRSILLLPMYRTSLKKSTSEDVWCKPFSLVSNLININSVFSILLIACDRYCAVQDPLHYVKINAKGKAQILVLCSWLLSLAITFPILFGFFELDYDLCNIASSTRSVFDPSIIYEATIILTSFILPLFSIIYLYYSMYRAAKNNLARCERYSCSNYGSGDIVVNMRPLSRSGGSEYSPRRHLYILEEENSQQINRFLNENRAAVTGLLVVVSFIIFWSPYFIIRFYQKFKIVTIQVKFWVQFPTFLSSIANPYLYFYRNRSTLRYIKNLVSRIFHRSKASMHIPTNMTHNTDSISNFHQSSGQSAGSRYSCRFSRTEQSKKVEIILHEQDSLLRKNNGQSAVTTKAIVHQYPSSSNNNSDLCLSVGNNDSSDSGETLCNRKQNSEEISSEEPH